MDRLATLLRAWDHGGLDRAQALELAHLLGASPQPLPPDLDERVEELIADLAATHGLVRGAIAPVTGSERARLWAAIHEALPGAARLPHAQSAAPWWGPAWLRPAMLGAAALVVVVVGAGLLWRLPAPQPTGRGKGQHLTRLESDLLVATPRGPGWLLAPLPADQAVAADRSVLLYFSVDRPGYIAVARVAAGEVELLVPESGERPLAVAAGRQPLRVRPDAEPTAIALADLSGPQELVVLWMAEPPAPGALRDLLPQLAAGLDGAAAALARAGVSASASRVRVVPAEGEGASQDGPPAEAAPGLPDMPRQPPRPADPRGGLEGR